MYDLLTSGFLATFNIETILLIGVSVALGLIFGSIPGLTATMAIALFLPITLGMEVINAMSFLMGLYLGGLSGGLIPAILLKIPGTPASVATTFDGYPMAQKGYADKALGLATISSFLGGGLSIIALILVAPPLATFAIRFGPIEYFAVTVFALTMVASLSGKTLTKGILSALLGLSLAMIGSAPIDAYPRFTFGFGSLDGGLSLLPVLIGLFGLSEIFLNFESSLSKRGISIKSDKSRKGLYSAFADIVSQKWNVLRSSIIGLLIGILPGIGASASNLIAYTTAKSNSKEPEKFGTGEPAGVIASESANNASVGGALIPLTVLGIPGDTATALLLGSLILHGLNPGPLLFSQSGETVYGIFSGLLIANLFVIVLLLFCMKFFIKVLSIPKYILMPIILMLCIVGSFGVNNRLFDVWTLLAIGVLGYLMIKFRYPLPPFILGFILGPIAEINLRRGLMLTDGSFLPFIIEPIPLVFFTVTIIIVFLIIWRNIKENKIKREV